MRRFWKGLSGVGFTAAIALLLASGPEVPGARAGAMPPSAPLSVLTYNIHGLPWPLAAGRPAAFRVIAERLKQLRDEGAQPHVVVLQEAFTASAKEIGAAAGYAYAASGPPAWMRNPEPASRSERLFEAEGSLLKGEGWGKMVDSGLMILSDYPILSARRDPFPTFACAGFDCLANKGVLLVTLKVPGLARPVQILATHLNSHAASGVGDARSNQAYRAETMELASFLRRNSNPADPILLAGDFNVGNRPARRSALLDGIAEAWEAAGFRRPQDALHDCMAEPATCAGAAQRDAREALARGRDWQFFASSPAYSMRVRDVRVLFGHEADGSMLSDHIGYAADYEVAAVPALPNPQPAARRPEPDSTERA